MGNFCKNLFKGGRRRHCGHACSLQDLPEGRRAKILEMLCSDDQRLRLCSLGLTPGTPVESCDRNHGTCRFLVRGSALVLDGELAGQVICEEEERNG